MISRYEKKEIAEIWEDHSKFQSYLTVELALLKALEGKKIPIGTSDIIRKKSSINLNRLYEIEKETKHDVIAFCTMITENLPQEVGKYFHFGVTSSDIIDSALSLQIKHSLDIIIPAMTRLLNALHKQAENMKDVATIGRSHGMFAEPMSFGVKLLGHFAEFERRLEDLKFFYKSELTVQFSGAVGNYTILTPEIEELAAQTLGLNVETHSTQIIPRDRIAKLVSITSLIACAIERLAVEMRHLHRSDVAELSEGFSKGQKGSSTMPHKKNPISAENLTGISRVIKSHMQIAMDNITLWHERDISHSSAERLFLPDNLGLTLYAVERMTSTIVNLVFHTEEIENKVKDNYTYLSSYYLHTLIEKTKLSREQLYKIVQSTSFKMTDGQTAEQFHLSLKSALQELDVSIDLPRPTLKEIKKIYLSQTENIFERVTSNWKELQKLTK